MGDFIRVPRAFKKRSKRSVLTVHTLSGGSSSSVVGGGGSGCVSGSGDEGGAGGSREDMVRKTYGSKEKKSVKRGSVKERWLLTRKTWKFMQDAGRRLLPDGVANKAEDIPKIEHYFQEVCRNEPKFLVWRRKCSYPGAVPVPRRRFKRRFGTVSHKKAGSADEAEDEYLESLERTQHEQLLMDMLKNYLNIKDDDPANEQQQQGEGEEGGQVGMLTRGDRHTAIPTSTSLLSLNAPSTTTSSSTVRTAPGAVESSSTSSLGRHANVVKTDRGTFTPTNNPFPLFGSTRDAASAQLLLANMRRCGGRGGSSLIDQITPEMLNDKVALRKLYNQLRATRRPGGASGSQFRIPSPKAQYQRSALGLHKTFAFPELSGKSRGKFQLNPLSGNAGSQEIYLRSTDPNYQGFVMRPPGGLDRDSLCATALEEEDTRIQFQTMGIQTDVIPLAVLNELSVEYKKKLEHEEALMREEEMANLELDPHGSAHRNNDRRNSEDVSQSVSDTIKRYLRMARKKPPKDDANRFKRVNYDRNLRNIKAKGETTKIGDDDGDCKGCQTDDEWIVKALEEAKSRPAVPERPTTLPRLSKNESTSRVSPSVSSPSSPGGIGSNIFHSSTQFLSNLFGHSQATTSTTASPSGSAANVEASSNDSIYGSSDAAMQKSKSSSNVGHIVSRKIWKSRSKSQSRPALPAKSQWTPQVSGQVVAGGRIDLIEFYLFLQGGCVWTSSHGHTIKLRESSLSELTEVERKTLQQLAIGKIHQFDLGVNTDFLMGKGDQVVMGRIMIIWFFSRSLGQSVYYPEACQEKNATSQEESSDHWIL